MKNAARRRREVGICARYSRLFALFAGCFCLGTLLGCNGEEKSKPSPPPPAATSVTLRVAVAEDTQLADAIKRLRGEWAERSGGELIVESLSLEQLLGPNLEDESLPPPDLLIFPSRHLGELCESKRLRPMRKSVLESDELRVNDFFPLVRERLMVFGGETMALPVGCVAPVVLVGEVDEPLTWERLKIASVGIRGGGTAIQAKLLLAAAASYADHTPGRALLFDPETITPRIVSPPFARALSEGVEHAAASANQTQTTSSIDFSWPVRGEQEVSSSGGRVARLPGVDEVFNPIAGEWEPVIGEPRRVPLLATSGCLVGVTTDSRNAASAFRLAAWLVGTQNARQLSTCSPHVANARKSLAKVADDWTGRGDKELGKQFAAAQAESLSGRHALLIPRIIRIDDYLTALDEQVGRAIAGEATAEEALEAASAAWEELTDEIGRDRQKQCYQAHLRGLGD